jgi:signal transduction histidine kinase
MLRARSARYQLVIGAIILIGGTIAGLSAIRWWERFLIDEALAERRVMVRSIAIGAEGILARHDVEDDSALVEMLTRIREGSEFDAARLVIRSSDGKVLTDAGPFATTEAAAPPWAEGAIEPGVHLLDESAGALGGILVTEALVRDGKEVGALIVEFDMSNVKRGTVRALTIIVMLITGGVLIMAAFVSFLIRRWVSPIEELSRKMNQVRVGNLDVELDESRRDEVGDLGRHFNDMLVSIRDARAHSVDLARKQANIEKFAALGRLSAGVAHEINNPVGGIITCIETMRGMESGSDRFNEYLDLVQSGLQRIGKIVKQLLRFARQPEGEVRQLDLNAILKEVMVLSLFHNRDEDVDVKLRFGQIPFIYASPDLLNQIFLNLVLNALQEMPEGGTLTVSTWSENGHVCASFEDTGSGIPEENLERIFEPFFTTKEVGVGTGLGLSVALGIIEAHGGTISASNREEGGARFTVTLPIGTAAPVAVRAEEILK